MYLLLPIHPSLHIMILEPVTCAENAVNMNDSVRSRISRFPTSNALTYIASDTGHRESRRPTRSVRAHAAGRSFVCIFQTLPIFPYGGK